MPRNYIKWPSPRTAESLAPWMYLTNLYAAYGFPKGTLPGGGVIGIGELGGGWVQSDVDAFFTRNKLLKPNITDISVSGGVNNKNPNDPASGEVALDIQIAASVYAYCTGKAADVRMYWAPNSATGIPDATAQAAKDGCDVMSWSWGADEAVISPQGCRQMEDVAAVAAAGGMVITAAAGDNDSSDGGPTPANVDNPASCPHVIACGGTRKPHGSGAETVWNNNPGQTDGEGTGGGFSTVFDMPSWQASYFPGKTGRVVPDVAANADPTTGYGIVIAGQLQPVGGTSAVAPLVAGLLAACGRKLGYLNDAIWTNPGAFLTAIAGNNGAFVQPPNPGACSGMGRPLGGPFTKLFAK